METNAIVKFQPKRNQIYAWDALQLAQHMPSESVNCIVTSPPYFNLREYTAGDPNEIGTEETPDQYVDHLLKIFRECRRILRSDGVFWLNIDDAYANDSKHGGGTGGKHAKALHGNTGIGRNRHKTGLPAKSLMGIPYRIALGLQANGWVFRCDCIWEKPDAMPSPQDDRPVRSHEYLFMFSKSSHYWYDQEAVREAYTEPMNRWGGEALVANGISTWDAGTKQNTYRTRNMRPNPNGRTRRSVWSINTTASGIPHYATYPEELVMMCISSGCPEGGLVYDPFMGVGTTALVAQNLKRDYMGSEINPVNVGLANARLIGKGQLKQHIAKIQGKPYMESLFETA